MITKFQRYVLIMFAVGFILTAAMGYFLLEKDVWIVGAALAGFRMTAMVMINYGAFRATFHNEWRFTLLGLVLLVAYCALVSFVFPEELWIKTLQGFRDIVAFCVTMFWCIETSEQD